MARRCLNTEAQRHRARSCTVPDASRVAGAGKVRLGDVCKIIGGGTPSKSNASFYTGNIPWASVRDMKEKVLSCTEYCISDIAVENSATNIIPQGEVVISTHVGLGKVCVLAQDTAINQDLKAIIPVEELNRDYLYHWFVSQARFIISHGHGITVKGVSVDFVKSMKIPLPPLPTQRRIAAELDRLCALKKNAEDRLAILDQIVKSRFVEMFGEESEWPHERIGGILQIERGGSPRPIDKYITDSPEGVNWIKIGDTVPGEIYIEHAKEKILKSGIVKSRKVLPGDFLLSNSMSFGRPYITKIEGYIHDGWLVLRDENKIFEKLFLHQLLSSQYVYKQFAKLASGSTVKNLNKDLVGRVEVPIPPLSLQREFAEFVASVDKLKAALRETVATLDQLYRAKLQEYFG